jgi:hypothetical protein
MARNEDDAERLLSLLEPQADATLPAGWLSGKPSDMAIGPPVVEYRTAQRGNRVLKIMTDESRKLVRGAATKWPVLDRNSPLAEEIWAQHAVSCMEMQRGLVPPKIINTAQPAGDGGMTSHILVVRR